MLVDERPSECRGIALHAKFSPVDAELVGLDVLNHRYEGHTVKERLLNMCVSDVDATLPAPNA